MNPMAFELVPPLSLKELNGATVAFGTDTQTFDIREALSDGEGVIVVDNDNLVTVLRANAILRETKVPEGAKPVELPVSDSAPDLAPTLYVPQSTHEARVVPGMAAPEAVHAPEPETVEEAAKQPESQVVDEPPADKESVTDSSSSNLTPPQRLGRNS